MVCIALRAFAQDDTRNLLETLPAGERTDFSVTIPAGKIDPETFIPVSVIKGSSPGPKVLMVAGVHGYEFAPILAAKPLAEEIEPKQLSGTLIIVRIRRI